MIQIKRFSLRTLVRFILIISFLSALAQAQETLQLGANTTCSTSLGLLTCRWSDSTGCSKTAQATFSPGPDEHCDGTTSIVQILDNGSTVTTTTDSCATTITVGSGCGNPPSGERLILETVDVEPSDGGPTCVAGRCVSPIIIDTTGQGFHLTSAQNGVRFDMKGDGTPIQIAWTAPGSGNAFLALDRNHNGIIDDGTELFGNFTQQPKSPTPNGFLALAEFDKPENGGNADGIIDEHDAVFSHLVLWIDENHDGIPQPNELHSLSEFGITSLSLNYKALGRKDEYGNYYHFRAKVNPTSPSDQTDSGRWAYDVFLVTK